MAVSGSYVVTFNVDLGAGAQPSAPVICKARIAPNSPAFRGIEERTIPVAAWEGAGAAMGRTATCSVQIPFYWAVDNLSGGVALSCQIETVSSGGAREVRARQNTAVPSPGAGGRATLLVNVTL
jgi:hypothetical protein